MARHIKSGDTVEIAECRPLSKTKHHRLLRIVQRAPEKAVQISAEEVMTGKAPEKLRSVADVESSQMLVTEDDTQSPQAV